METRHIVEERQTRTYLIDNIIGDTNNVICKNVIDRGHANGAERFELTDKAISEFIIILPIGILLI